MEKQEKKKARMAKIILKKKKGKKQPLPDFEDLFKAIIIKTVWHWWKYKYLEQ